MPRPRIRQRVTGISTPFGGISWETQPDVEKEVITRLIALLEDRRVLYNPPDIEVVEQCVASVLDIRRHLVAEIGLLPRDSDLATILRSITAACRHFLDQVPDARGHHPLGPFFAWDAASWRFYRALGEFRAQLGFYLGLLVKQLGVKLPEPLAGLLPPEPDPIEPEAELDDATPELSPGG